MGTGEHALPGAGRAEPVLRDPDGLVGRVIAGKYEVLDVLARGGMGRIYRAVQTPLGRPVALKVLHDELAEESLSGTGGEGSFQRRFLREAASCARLTHPNIVVVYDYGPLTEVGRDAYFMAMELIDGPTLGQAIKEAGVFTPGRALRVMREVARALREAHRQGMVHRDLKPSNVMLASSGEGEQVKVLDFGLVKLVRDDSEELTKEGLFLGSPKYMAPEQIRRAPVDGRADIYALGVLTYQMLTGRLPFEGDQPVQTLMAHLNDPVPPIDPRLDIPAPVQAIVIRCLEKDPQYRYADADALIRAIDEAGRSVAGYDSGRGHSLMSGEAPTVTASSVSMHLPATLVPPGERPASRGPGIAVLAVLVVLAALVAAGLALGVGSEPPPAPTVTVLSPQTPPTPPPVARTFTLFVESTPPGATLVRGAERIGTTPTYVELGADALTAHPETFRIELDGYAPYVWTQGPSTDDVRVSPELASLAPVEPVRDEPARPDPPVRRPPRGGGGRVTQAGSEQSTPPPPRGEEMSIKTRR